MKTSKLSHGQNEIATINLLRQRAAEFLNVAANLEAQQKFGNFSTAGRITGTTGITIGMGSPPRRKMSLVARRKIAKAAKARAAKRKLEVVGKAA
jgi:hypothetical protein